MAKKSKMNAVERDLVQGLEELRDILRDDVPLEERLTVRRVRVSLARPAYTPALVKQTREVLSASQALFAQFLGVSPSTVRAWELGKAPSDMACRFMDEIRLAPKYWQKRFKQATRVRT